MQSARLSVTSGGALNASTYTASSFQIENLSNAGEPVTSVSIDLSGAMITGMIFDPAGLAGDTVAKPFTVDGQTGAFTVTSVSFGGGSDAAGYKTLTLQLAGFDPGESLRFSVDVDPASIQGVGAPGPGESGSVAGVELTGAQAIFDFGGLSLANELFKEASSQGGGVTVVTAGLPAAPTVAVSGVSGAAATVASTQQTVHVAGPAGGGARVLVMEGGAFVQGVPSAAPDLGPYQANTALKVTTYDVALDAQGQGQVLVTLTDSAPEGALNLITAATMGPGGVLGPVSDPIALALDASSGAGQVLAATGANATLIGGAGNDSVSGVSGSNYLRGGGGDDLVFGGTGFDDAHGNTGADTVRGGQGDDWVLGGQGEDQVFGDAGADILNGNLGRDTCNGGQGSDWVRGGQGDDVLNGGAGDDWLSGDRGSDTVTGGLGADTFNLFADAGVDTVIDFNVLEGDRVRLEPGAAYSAAQVGADTVVTVGAAQLILAGVQLSSLGAGWIFGG